MKRACAILALLLFAGNSVSAADNLTRMEWKVDGVAREALVYAPATAKTDPSPVVFAFHGHGGTMKYAANKFAYHKHWPEAIVVYMQGLNTPGALTDPEGKLPGWQKTFGDQGDRDLKFFDAVLATLKKDYKVDEKRIYATGHSNGGGFTYLLWAAPWRRVRGDSRPVRRRPSPSSCSTSSPSRCCTWRARTIRWCGSRGSSGLSTQFGSSTAAARASPGASIARCIRPRAARRS